MKSFRQIAGLCAVLAATALPSAAFGSDILLVHGHIYTGNPKAPWASALAITGTRIDAVGTDEEVLARRDAKTHVIDLQGRTVIPAISDSHTHIWFGRGERLSLSRKTNPMSKSIWTYPSLL